MSVLEFTFNISSIFLDITVCCAYYLRPTKIKTVKISGVGVYAYFRDHDVSVAAAIQVPDHETRSHEGMFREDVKQSDHTNPHKLLIHVHSCIVFTPFVWQTVESLELLHCLINQSPSLKVKWINFAELVCNSARMGLRSSDVAAQIEHVDVPIGRRGRRLQRTFHKGLI